MNQQSETNPAAKNSYLAVKIIFLCLAAGFFLLVLVLSLWNFYLLARFEKASGVVASVNITQTTGKTAATFYEYYVSFQTSKNTIYANAGKTVFYQAFSKGDSVTIYYNPQNPFEAFINTLSTIWFVPMILLALGVLMLVLSKLLSD